MSTTSTTSLCGGFCEFHTISYKLVYVHVQTRLPNKLFHRSIPQHKITKRHTERDIVAILVADDSERLEALPGATRTRVLSGRDHMGVLAAATEAVDEHLEIITASLAEVDVGKANRVHVFVAVEREAAVLCFPGEISFTRAVTFVEESGVDAGTFDQFRVVPMALD